MCENGFLLYTDKDVVLHTDMSTVDMKPTDIEIEVSPQSHVSCKSLILHNQY